MNIFWAWYFFWPLTLGQAYMDLIRGNRELFRSYERDYRYDQSENYQDADYTRERL